MKLLAAGPGDILFGTIAPPQGMESFAADPAAALGKLLSVALQIILIVAAIILLIFLLWGAIEIITSGGDKEKVSKAQHRLTAAVVGIIVVIATLTIFVAVNREILGNKIIEVDDTGWHFVIPTIGP